jgi:hypothetical protein
VTEKRKLLQLSFTPAEAIVMGIILGQIVKEMEPQLNAMDQDQRTFYVHVEHLAKLFPKVEVDDEGTGVHSPAADAQPGVGTDATDLPIDR